MFGSGVAFYAFRHRVPLSRWAGICCLIALFLAALNRSTFNITLLLVGPYLVFCACYLPSGFIRSFNRFGDYSYGVYIYGYPSQFSIISFFPWVNPWQLTALAVPVALILAALSWHLVEERSVRSVARWVSLAGRLRSYLAIGILTRK